MYCMYCSQGDILLFNFFYMVKFFYSNSPEAKAPKIGFSTMIESEKV